jgi:hypothetical protein
MAFNEPNFPDQANLSPQAAANAWPALRALANELGLKIVSPAMNFGSNMNQYDWMRDFLNFIGPEAAAEIHAIAIHTYPWWPSTTKSLLDPYRQYGKKLWITEFCGWEDVQDSWRTSNWQMQAWYLSAALTYLEMDPDVERYAWFMPKGRNSQNNHPFFNLLTNVPNGGDVQLTELGKVFVNMTILDKTVWVPAGTKIDASQYTSCNLADVIGRNDAWSDPVVSMPTDDSDKSAGILDIRCFGQATNNGLQKWVEYQVNLPTAKTYTLTLRYKTAASTNVAITIDGGAAINTTLNERNWAEATVDLGNLAAGNHTIRLRGTSRNGDINNSGTAASRANYYLYGTAFNWLRVD